VRRIGTVSSDPKTVRIQSPRPEFEGGTGNDVSREEADDDTRLTLEPVEQRENTGHHCGAAFRLLQLMREQIDIA